MIDASCTAGKKCTWLFQYLSNEGAVYPAQIGGFRRVKLFGLTHQGCVL